MTINCIHIMYGWILESDELFELLFPRKQIPVEKRGEIVEIIITYMANALDTGDIFDEFNEVLGSEIFKDVDQHFANIFQMLTIRSIPHDQVSKMLKRKLVECNQMYAVGFYVSDIDLDESFDVDPDWTRDNLEIKFYDDIDKLKKTTNLRKVRDYPRVLFIQDDCKCCS